STQPFDLLQVANSTALLMNNPADLETAQFFKSLIFNNSRAEVDLWMRRIPLNDSAAKTKKNNAKETLGTITPISALMFILRCTLKYTAPDPKLLCEELVQALEKLGEKSNATDWEPLLMVNGENEEGPLNEFIALLLVYPDNQRLIKLAEIVLSKASKEAIDHIFLDHKKEIIKTIPGFNYQFSMPKTKEAPKVVKPSVMPKEKKIAPKEKEQKGGAKKTNDAAAVSALASSPDASVVLMPESSTKTCDLEARMPDNATVLSHASPAFFTHNPYGPNYRRYFNKIDNKMVDDLGCEKSTAEKNNVLLVSTFEN
ncbi:MAG: hypothetical protein NTU49_05330, partial [Gammaproteobacteria bacterium]|nr:hypothetical protein [Gammaproteobacteria bacterium]